MTETHLPTAPAGLRPRHGGGALLTTAVVLNAAVLLVGSTVATFTGREPVTQANSAGNVLIELDAAGKAALAVAGPALAAGDWFTRAVTVAPKAGTIEIGSWTLAAKDTSANPSGLANSLIVKVESCSVTWGSTTDANGVVTHTCSGTRGAVLGETPLPLSETQLGGLGQGTHHLLLTMKLAATAPDTLQGASSTVQYTFGGVQRAGKQR